MSKLFSVMSIKQTNKVKCNGRKFTQMTTGKNRGSRRDRLSPPNWLKDHPFLFVAGAIIILTVIACFVWIALRWLQACFRSKGITLFSMDAGLSNWFSLFISYASAVATVVLGILTARLTIKQNQSDDYAAISELTLDDFLVCDLWHEYTPTCFERDLGRRFVLSFNISGLKMYYSIRDIELSWKPAGDEAARYVMLENQEVLHQSTQVTKVTAYFDEFPDCGPDDSIYYFLRLNLYEPNMMTPEERRRWIQMYVKLDYADDKMESDVYCDYLLEYNGTTVGTTHLRPVDHRIRISSSSKKHSREGPNDK